MYVYVKTQQRKNGQECEAKPSAICCTVAQTSIYYGIFYFNKWLGMQLLGKCLNVLTNVHKSPYFNFMPLRIM